MRGSAWNIHESRLPRCASLFCFSIPLGIGSLLAHAPVVKALLLVAAVTVVSGCKSGPSSDTTPGSVQDAGSRQDAASLAMGVPVYGAARGVLIRDLFVDDGKVLILADDMQTASLTQIGSQVPLFTTPLAGAAQSITDLTVAVIEAAGTAFYTSNGALHAVPIQGGSDQVLGMPGSCIPMFADATTVFCALGGMVISFSLPQGAMQMVTDLSPATVDDLYADATTLYLTSHNGAAIGTDLSTAPRAGGGATALTIATPQQGGFSFFRNQVDDANVYLQVGGGIARLSKATHQITSVFQNGDASASCFGWPTIVGGYFYYSCGLILTRGPLATGKPTVVVVASSDGIEHTVVTNNTAYWASFVTSAGREAVETAQLPP
jgi:hypothetical protein